MVVKRGDSDTRSLLGRRALLAYLLRPLRKIVSFDFWVNANTWELPMNKQWWEWYLKEGWDGVAVKRKPHFRLPVTEATTPTRMDRN